MVWGRTHGLTPSRATTEAVKGRRQPGGWELQERSDEAIAP